MVNGDVLKEPFWFDKVPDNRIEYITFRDDEMVQNAHRRKKDIEWKNVLSLWIICDGGMECWWASMVQKKWLSLFRKSGRRYFHFSLLLFMDEREYWWFWKSERTYFHPTHESLLGFLLNVDHLYLQEVIVHHRQLSGGDVRRGWKDVICQTNRLWVVVVHFFAVAFFADLLKSCSLFLLLLLLVQT